jgi:hypothetical protein
MRRLAKVGHANMLIAQESSIPLLGTIAAIGI